MTIQEILDAIEAEIKETQVKQSAVKLGTKEAAYTVLCIIAYVNGLRFAKDLIEKANEVGA